MSDGQVYTIKTNTIDLDVTLNHQMYVCIDNKKYNELTIVNELIGKKNIKYKNDGNLNKEQFIYKPFEDFKNNMISWIILFGILYSKAFYLNKTIIIYYNLSEIELIINCLNKLELKYDICINANKIIILNNKLFTYMKNIKEIPEWCLQLNKNQSFILIKTLITHNCYYTENNVDADRFMHLCFHSGMHCIKKNILSKGYLLKFNNINKNIKESIYNYKGIVYSLEVPSGIFYIRKNGKSCWIGEELK